MVVNGHDHLGALGRLHSGHNNRWHRCRLADDCGFGLIGSTTGLVASWIFRKRRDLAKPH